MKKIFIDSTAIKVQSEQCVFCNLLTVTAGTNCPQGGDAGHGGKTYLALTNDGGTCMDAVIKTWEGESFQIDQIEKIELIFGGDCECETLIEALEFAVAVLKGQSPATARRIIQKHADWKGHEQHGTA
jgi:hypothetical protein